MDKSKLLADRVTIKTEQVEIEGVGTITVRPLSRAELLLSEKKYPGDLMAQERFVLSRAIVDPAGMTEKDVEAWQEASLPQEINAVAMVVNRISGLTKEAPKEAYKSV